MNTQTRKAAIAQIAKARQRRFYLSIDPIGQFGHDGKLSQAERNAIAALAKGK